MNLFCRKVFLSRGMVLLTVVCFGVNMTVSAAMVYTPQIASEYVSQNQLEPIIALTSNDNNYRTLLEQELVALGVDAKQVHNRLNSMTDSEIAALSSEISELPAGGDALTTIAFIFLVLLFTDIAGYTDLFPFVKKTTRNTRAEESDGQIIDRRVERKRKDPIVIEN